MNLLIKDIQLLSNHKSFLLGVGNTKSDLWLLLHFKHLEIKDYKICYQRNNGIHQRKSTVYPKRCLKKRFNTTAELLDYLYSKFYDIHYLQIEFTNGWAIKELPQISYNIYTSSTEERDTLINKLLFIAGLDPIDIPNLKLNISYYFKATGQPYCYDNDPSPDEFWSEQRLSDWKKLAAKSFNTTEENLSPDDHPINDTHFVSTYINDDKTSF